MTFAVRYYTKTGNTKRLAEAIAKELGVEALHISEPVNEAVDYLFLGNSYYAFTIDPEVKAFVASLDKTKIGKIVNFGSAAMLNSTYKKVKKVADKVGIPMDGKEFHCKGEFKGIHKGRPNEEDIAAAVEFAKQYIQCRYKLTAKASRDSDIVDILFGLTDYCYWLYVTDLGVDRNYERRGIATKMMKQAHELAGGEKDIAVYLIANENAVPFLLKTWNEVFG